MRKKLLLFIFCIIFCGCSHKTNGEIGTIIEETDNYIVAINYPITNTKIDSKIKKEVDFIYSNFVNDSNKDNDKSELNIDYTFHYIDHYICVALYIYKNNHNDINNSVKTFLYDTNKKKEVQINDIVEDNDIIESIIEEKFQKKMDYSFIFDRENLVIFIEDKNEVETITIPLSDLDLKIKLFPIIQDKTVSVSIPERVIDPNQKVVALTFDDGPSQYTEKIIDILHEKNCNATFFVLGNKVSNYSDILKKSLEYGNEIGNHSYNHKWLIKLKPDEIMEQINKTQQIIKEYTGYTPKLLRPTYGSVNSFIKSISSLNVVLWNVDTLDWKYKNVNRIVNNATKKLKDGNIILMHDTHKQTLESLPKIVDIIQEKEFQCVTVSELKEIQLIREQFHE